MTDYKNIAPVADFDWEAFENGGKTTSDSREAQEQAYTGSLNKVSDHDVVDGTVIAMNKREVVVNIGFKSDGIIPASEFRYNPDLKVGDTVEVYIENQEGPAHPLSQEGTCKPLLGPREPGSGERGNHQGLREVPHKGWHDRGCIRHRGIPARLTD